MSGLFVWVLTHDHTLTEESSDRVFRNARDRLCLEARGDADLEREPPVDDLLLDALVL
jgi:hypothetical protein